MLLNHISPDGERFVIRVDETNGQQKRTHCETSAVLVYHRKQDANVA